MDLDMHEYAEKLISDGYIAEDGTPLKCQCGCEQLKSDNTYYEDTRIIEYSVFCTECGTRVGIWSYGCWVMM